MTDTRPRGGSAQLVQEAGDARLEVDPIAGGRISSLVVRGLELLARTGDAPFEWGCFPMVPYAGRVRDGTFTFAGRRVELPRTLPPHAAHGTVSHRPWHVVDDRTLSIDLGRDWPFRGRAVQHFDLRDGVFEASLSLEADEPMPGAVGWHPWFRRRLAGSASRPAAPSAPAVLGLDAAGMFARDSDGIPTGTLVEPDAGPWDDCFTGLRAAPTLTWPGVLRLEVASSCSYWVIYDEPPDTICVEPQSSPPDGVHLDPVVVTPGEPLIASMTWRWWAPGSMSSGDRLGQSS